MRLHKLIKKLQKIAMEKGDTAEVLMADGIKVVDPVYFNDYFGVEAVIITDHK